MNKKVLMMMLLVAPWIGAAGQKVFEKDTIQTLSGNLVITFIGHSSLVFTYHERNIYIDPVSQLADFSSFPKADAILITHDHGDHFDPTAIEKLTKPETEIYLSQLCYDKLKKGKVCKSKSFFITNGVPVLTLDAYNYSRLRGNGIPYHPKGQGNGYFLTFGQTTVFVAGDTELTDEMYDLKGKIDIAFLPIGLPYTMDPNMAISAAKLLKIKILYPYHFNNSIPEDILKALKGSETEVRIRSMK